MGNHIYKSILKENAEDFFNKFIRHSRTRNTNPDTKRITHTGMFGTEREQIAMRFLGLLSPATIALANNAKLITPFEGESTECDIVLYDNYNNPIIKSDEYKYVPIEIVSSVVEVKSTLTKSQLTKALRKLSEVKKMRLHLNKFEFSRRNHQKGETQHYTEHIPLDQIFTVLICEKLDFNLQLINFEEIYKDIPRTMWHNLVYSIDDGVFGYISPGDGVKNPWPNHLRDPSGIFFQPSKYDCDDWGLNIFCQFFNLGLRTTQTFDFEIIRYLTPLRDATSGDKEVKSSDLKINYTISEAKRT